MLVYLAPPPFIQASGNRKRHAKADERLAASRRPIHKHQGIFDHDAFDQVFRIRQRLDVLYAQPLININVGLR